MQLLKNTDNIQNFPTTSNIPDFPGQWEPCQ